MVLFFHAKIKSGNHSTSIAVIFLKMMINMYNII